MDLDDTQLCSMIGNNLCASIREKHGFHFFKYQFKPAQIFPERLKKKAYCDFRLAQENRLNRIVCRLTLRQSSIILWTVNYRPYSIRSWLGFIWEIIKGCNPKNINWLDTWGSYWNRGSINETRKEYELCDPNCFDNIAKEIVTILQC